MLVALAGKYHIFCALLLILKTKRLKWHKALKLYRFCGFHTYPEFANGARASYPVNHV
jgi:hypothetical protein